MKRRHFLLGFAQGLWSCESLRDGLPLNLTSQTEMGSVSQVVAACAVASGLTTLARGSGDGAPAEVAKTGQLTEQVAALRLQLGQGLRR